MLKNLRNKTNNTHIPYLLRLQLSILSAHAGEVVLLVIVFMFYHVIIEDGRSEGASKCFFR